mmetsp:Transcript_7594/g.14921  ORF Transcript_7594/g.14921 Transcript_7594/m.14921 type:complete len:106 (+) Transcript_7594:1346-1663(+)
MWCSHCDTKGTNTVSTSIVTGEYERKGVAKTPSAVHAESEEEIRQGRREGGNDEDEMTARWGDDAADEAREDDNEKQDDDGDDEDDEDSDEDEDEEARNVQEPSI